MTEELALTLASNLSTPARTAIAIRWGVLGMSGSGKSYTASKLIETMLDVGAQAVILDNDGKWYGLRLPTSGRHGKGYDIPIFGGLHGDIPLEPTAGALVADLIVDFGISVILDISTMRKGKRHQFAADFAEQLFYRKQTQKNPTPLSLAIEESDEYCPQQVFSAVARMAGAFEDIGTQGRKYGIGSIWISQRPQSINKQVLNQCEVILAHQMLGAQEREAMQKWIVHKRLDLKLVDELADLPVGTAYVWSPRWLRQIEKVKIHKKRSLDTSSTPEFGQGSVSAKEIRPIDLDAIRAQMKETIEKAENNNPAKLQTRIQQLTLQVKQLQSGVAAPAEKIETVKIVEIPLKADVERIEQLVAEVDSSILLLRQSVSDWHEITQQSTKKVRGLLEKVVQAHTPVTPTPRIPPPSPAPTPKPVVDYKGQLRAGARRLLGVVQRWPGLTRENMCLLSFMVESGTVTTYMGALKGYLEFDPKNEGYIPCKEMPEPVDFTALAPKSAEEILNGWLAMKALRGATKDLLRAFSVNFPYPMTVDAVCAKVGMANSGTLGTYLSILTSRNLIVSTGEGRKVKGGPDTRQFQLNPIIYINEHGR